MAGRDTCAEVKVPYDIEFHKRQAYDLMYIYRLDLDEAAGLIYEVLLSRSAATGINTYPNVRYICLYLDVAKRIVGYPCQLENKHGEVERTLATRTRSPFSLFCETPTGRRGPPVV